MHAIFTILTIYFIVSLVPHPPVLLKSSIIQVVKILLYNLHHTDVPKLNLMNKETVDGMSDHFMIRFDLTQL